MLYCKNLRTCAIIQIVTRQFWTQIEVVDNWPADRCGIGFVNILNRRRLLYVTTYGCDKRYSLKYSLDAVHNAEVVSGGILTVLNISELVSHIRQGIGLTSRYGERVTCGHGSGCPDSPLRVATTIRASGRRCGQEFAAARTT